MAVIDSGIEGDLPDFRTSATDPTSRVVETAVTNPYATTAGDPYGHGTHVISVGAVDDKGTKEQKDDVVASWSSRGTTQDGLAKPDVVAPGAHIVSTLASGSEFTQLCASCVVGGQYIRAGGTSMAAPVVAGLAADLLQGHPTWTPDQVKGALLTTARPLPGSATTKEIVGDKANGAKSTANQGLTPAPLVSAGGSVDYTRSSWSRSSWSTAPSGLTAGWARSSWSCTCSLTSSGGIDPTRSSWSTSTWSTAWNL